MPITQVCRSGGACDTSDMGGGQQGDAESGDDRQRDSAAAEVGDGRQQNDGEGGRDWLVVLGNFSTIKLHIRPLNATCDITYSDVKKLYSSTWLAKIINNCLSISSQLPAQLDG